MNHRRFTARQRALLIQNLPLVRGVARRVVREMGGRAELDELEGFGMDGLVKAVLRFDAHRGVSFATFARFRVRGAMLDALRRARREVFFARPAADFLAGDLPPALDEVTSERQVLTLLGSALSRLDPRERQMLGRVYRDGTDLKSAGAELGLSKSWSSRVHARALGRLRRALARAV